MQLKRVGLRKLSEMKRDCREFEQHMLVNYDYEISKKPDSQLKKFPGSPEPKYLSNREKKGAGKRPRKLIITTSGSFSSPSVTLPSNQFEKDPQS